MKYTKTFTTFYDGDTYAQWANPKAKANCTALAVKDPTGKVVWTGSRMHTMYNTATTRKAYLKDQAKAAGF